MQFLRPAERCEFDGNDVIFVMAEGARRAQKGKGGALQTALNVFGAVLCVLFIPIIILNVVMIIRSYTDPDHIPSVFGISPVIVLSGSMSPEFEAGDMIFIQKTDPNTLQVNDVICFLEEETAVTHRIMEVQQQDGETLYVTQGDANNIEDATPVSPEQVQGKYMGIHLTGAGNFAMFLQSTPGMFLFIGGPILLFLLWDILRRALAGRQANRERQKLQTETSTKQQEMEAMERELERLRAQVNGSGSSSAVGSAPAQQDMYTEEDEEEEIPPMFKGE